MVSKYEYLILTGAFPDKVITDIYFTDEVVVQCDFPAVKMYCLWTQFFVLFSFLRI